ncbi:MAG: amidase [Pseudomonadota bacterium]
MTALWQYSAEVIAAMVTSRTVSARESVASAIERMQTVNPAINAVVDEMAESALAEAGAVDAAVAAGRVLPLAGVPVTIKVNTDVAGHATNNGLRVQADLMAPSDSPVTRALRAAGAVVIGRTNTPAFSIRWFARNSLYGDTLNPHDRGLTPGGSSGGAGAAVAAGIGAIAQGTDIAGSVRYPAYACGVHGLRPSLGRIAAVNASAPDRSMGAQITAVSGPLARSIADLRLGLAAMAAPDPRDPWWMPVPLEGHALPERVARRVGLCFAPDGTPTAAPVRAAVARAAEVLAAAGYVVEEVTPPAMRPAAAANMALWMSEFRGANLEKLAREADPDALIVAEHLMAIAGEAEHQGDAWTALQRRAGMVREWQIFQEDWPLLLCPVSGEGPFAAHRDVDGSRDFAELYEAQLSQVALPLLGLPGLTVATGSPGAPMGVQLIGPRFREDLLFEAGAAIEAAGPPIAPVDPFATG